MKEEIKDRIEKVKRGEVPQGYKKTTVGIVPQEWEIEKLGCIATISSGLTPSKANESYWNGNIPWITTTLINKDTIDFANEFITEHALNETSIKVIEKGAILMAMYGQGKTRGQVSLLNIDATINQACAAIAVERNINEYVFVALKNIYFSIRNMSNVGSQENLNSEIISSIKLSIPTLIEQQKIADILSKWDEAVALQEKLIEKLELQKKALMQKLLTPKEGWNKFLLSDLGSTYGGLNGKEKDDFGLGKPYITYNNIFSNFIISSKKFDYVRIKAGETQNLVKYGDIFFTTSSETPEEIGISSVLLDDIDELYLNSFCFGFRLNCFDTLTPEFAAYYFRSNTFREMIKTLAQGVTRFNLSKTNLMKNSVLLPNMKFQKNIAGFFLKKDSVIELEKKKLEKLKQQQKAMQQLLLTGIVRVSINER